jgi:hypothetical protein
MPICKCLVESALRKAIRRARDLRWKSPCDTKRSLEILAILGLSLVAIEATSSFDWAQQAMQKETSSTQGVSPKQHFACNVGYTLSQCQVATMVLRKALARYPVAALGEWTWVLVRTEDWKQIPSVRKFDTSNPVFSYPPKRRTFLDGALLVRKSIRGVELSAKWHMRIEDLLDLAIRHELAHALCNDRDESKVDRATIELKNRTRLSCQDSQQLLAVNPR